MAEMELMASLMSDYDLQWAKGNYGLCVTAAESALELCTIPAFVPALRDRLERARERFEASHHWTWKLARAWRRFFGIRERRTRKAALEDYEPGQLTPQEKLGAVV